MQNSQKTERRIAYERSFRIYKYTIYFLNNTLNTEKSINAVIQKFNDSKIHDDASKIGLNINYLYGWPLTLFVINDLLNKTDDVTSEEDLKFLRNRYVSKLDQIELISVNAFQLWFDFSNKKFSWTEDFEQFINNKELKIIGWNNPLESLLIALKFHKISKCFLIQIILFLLHRQY